VTVFTDVERRAVAVYPQVRDAVQAMKAAVAAGHAAPSDYWNEELENIDYLAEASPLILRKLRHHAFHLTNIRPYDYRDKHGGKRAFFEARLAALRQLAGDELLVPESPALGGFGYDIDGRLFNVDTIKFYEVLAGMQRAGALTPFRTGRRMVWEIGAGWGGFAYQFKTLFPNTTYVVTDFPELFLFSAVYLLAQFPGARVKFVGADAPASSAAGWADADFVFVPNTLTDVVAQAPLDLAINMVSFQEMTGGQVTEYAGIAARSGCPAVYSLNRERSPYNTELTSVSGVLAERYNLREITVLDTEYTSAMKKAPKGGAKAERSEFTYRHLFGTLKSASTGTGPLAVLGMTLYNNARHLREAADSLLSQSRTDFVLLMLDDGSSDATEAIAREYEQRDARVRYLRHPQRQGMVPTWHEVVEWSGRDYPGATYFAWVSDHDRWHPEWLARLVTELDAHPEAVLAYPFVPRIDGEGNSLDKEPRRFETAGITDAQQRWRRFCREGIGSGDMVYGLMRIDALRGAGIFRPVLRPDRLLVAEMTLQGEIRQVPQPLWIRRQSSLASVSRQGTTLFAGPAPHWFGWPPWLQHAYVLMREYGRSAAPPVRIGRLQLAAMLLLYQTTYGWRHLRKAESVHAIGRGIDNAYWLKKVVKRTYHRAVYWTLVEGRRIWGRLRRQARRLTYGVLVLSHRLGVRGIDHAYWLKKVVRRTYHRAVYWTLVEGRRMWGRLRRQAP
jgi:glycosyltransferase involved in cell wall biosynthesis